jgi:septal ring factor EnvC (AmiA/AmiB activator)
MFAVIAMLALAAVGGIFWAAVAGAQAAEASATSKATALDMAAAKEQAKANADAIKKQQEDHAALEARLRIQEQTAAATLNALQNLKETTERIERKIDNAVKK